MKKALLILFSFLSFSSYATHNRAGEIIYRCLGGYTYEISIITYTKGSSTIADRCTQTIYFGDSDSAEVCRSNFESGDPATDVFGAGPCSDPICTFHHMGEWTIGTPSFQSLNVKKNIYTTIHTYPGPGNYIIHMTDPNRNGGIINIPNSLTAFSIQDTLKISTILGCNTSPVLVNPPIDRACGGKLFIHNPGAVDPDGDSLSYRLGVCYEDYNTPVSGYFIPSGVSVDPITGDFIWNVPPNASINCDEYNFAMDIEEWRKSPTNGHYYKIATVRRDMQITVCDCQNDPPIVDNVNDTCILENTALTFTVSAHDLSGDNIQSFTGTGGPFNANPAATFISDVPPPQNVATGVFNWTPSCNEVRHAPYLVTFKALDDGAPDSPPNYLSDYESFFIYVIAPAPQNLTASPKCSYMQLSWDPEVCNPAPNPLLHYSIYRKLGCDTLSPGPCETGVPSSWGYTLIATVGNTTTTYQDNNGGNGLTHGVIYGYRVVADYLDGAESYASAPVCEQLVRDVPIITNVDVTSTGTGGAINVKWVLPVANAANFDTTAWGNQGPYKLELLRASNYANPVPPAIATFTSTSFAALTATSYLDSPLNTAANPYNYRLDFYSSASTSTCPAQNASSIFLSCNPNDNQIQITWNEHVPWVNSNYEVYKYNTVTTNWDFLDSTHSQSYTDTGLVNGAQYCYKVKSIGAYSDTTLPAPLINWSQELCCSPLDHTPPCPLTLAVDSSCDLQQNVLNWNNPNNSCCNDAIYYIIYHSDSLSQDYYVLDTINNINITTYLHDSLTSIAGCYAITAVDSFGNESLYSNIVCVDNCPSYELPNVFTPNGDGSNDLYTPLHPYKYVKDIDITIYNRWGYPVFHTTDPEIGWDGKSAQTKMLCSDGVYFYACIVNDIRLKGIVPRVLKGNIHLLRSK